MLSVDHARWGQTPEDLRRLALSAPHPRTRERFLALYDITQQSRGVTCVAARTDRCQDGTNPPQMCRSKIPQVGGRSIAVRALGRGIDVSCGGA